MQLGIWTRLERGGRLPTQSPPIAWQHPKQFFQRLPNACCSTADFLERARFEPPDLIRPTPLSQILFVARGDETDHSCSSHDRNGGAYHGPVPGEQQNVGR